jgi:hypothetical protein
VSAAAVIESLPRDAARMLAVEILLAEPEFLGDDVLESCLYVLREKLRAGVMIGGEGSAPAPPQSNAAGGGMS